MEEAVPAQRPRPNNRVVLHTYWPKTDVTTHRHGDDEASCPCHPIVKEWRERADGRMGWVTVDG